MRRLGQAVLAAVLIMGIFAIGAQSQVPGGGGVIQFLTGVAPTSVSATNPLPVTSSGGGLAANVTVVSPLGSATANTAAVSITDTGTPITGQTLGAGGQGLIGWLSQVYSAVTGPIPAGTNVIGHVIVDAGTAVIGHVIADAGTAIIGKVGIDQTTPGSTNGVTIAPTSAAAAGITPVVSAAGEASHVLKASAGNAYSVYATNLTTTQGFLVVLNSTTAPADGAITPLACAPLAPNGIASISYGPGPPGVFSTGITAVVTSANTCFTKTTGVITAFISGSVQ